MCVRGRVSVGLEEVTSYIPRSEHGEPHRERRPSGKITGEIGHGVRQAAFLSVAVWLLPPVPMAEDAIIFFLFPKYFFEYYRAYGIMTLDCIGGFRLGFFQQGKMTRQQVFAPVLMEQKHL